MKQLIATIGCALMAFCNAIAAPTDNTETEATTIMFADVEAIHDPLCAADRGLSYFEVGDFEFTFVPVNSTTDSPKYCATRPDVGEVNAIWFYLGNARMSNDKSALNYYSGDMMIIVSKSGRNITRVEAKCFSEGGYPKTFFSDFKTPFDSYTYKDNTLPGNTFVYLSPNSVHSTNALVPENRYTYALLQGVTIYTAVEEPEDRTFKMEMKNVQFKADGKGASYMDFDLAVQNDEAVDSYHLLVTDPNDKSRVFCDEVLNFDSENGASYVRANAVSSRTMHASVRLTNLNNSGNTPVSISIIPQAKSYVHPETPSAVSDISTGVDEIRVEDAETTAEYYDINGRRVSSPTNGLYILRRGATVSKVVVKD